jgi:hypothetical protein
VDTSTLKVDSANDRVGIGTASPAQFVHLSKSSTSTALTAPPVGGASLRIQNTSSTNNNFGSVEFYNANGLFGGSVNCQFTNQATPTNDLVFVTRGSSGGLEHYRIAADGVCTWSEVGGVAGTAMTLNSTGLGVGMTPAFKIHTNGVIGTTNTFGAFTALQTAGGTGYRWTLANDNNFYLQYSPDGFGSTATSRIALDSSGNVGVGVTPSGGYKLEVSGKIGATNAIEITGNNSVSAATGNGQAAHGSSTTLGNVLLGQGSSYDITFLNKSGSVAGYVATGATTITTSSDERIKENLVPITNAISKVSLLRGVIGNFVKDFDPTLARQPFLIAQDVDKVLPEAVVKANPDQWGVNYTQVIPLLVAAIQELTAEVNALKNA